MQFYGDYHTHTRNSDGHQDVEQVVAAARDRGLKEVAITDHGPLAVGIGVKDAGVYLEMQQHIEELNKKQSRVKVLAGAEANIRDMEGSLDIPSDVIEELDIVIAGLHPYTWPTSIQDGLDIFLQNSLRHLGKSQRQKAINANTKAIVEAIYNNPRLDILSHPGLFFRINVAEVARACIKNEVLFEINCGHEHPDISDIMKADDLGVEFIVNSDSHFPESVGQLNYGSDVIERLNIDSQKVANAGKRGGSFQWCKKMKTYTYL